METECYCKLMVLVPLMSAAVVLTMMVAVTRLVVAVVVGMW